MSGETAYIIITVFDDYHGVQPRDGAVYLSKDAAMDWIHGYEREWFEQNGEYRGVHKLRELEVRE